MYWFCKSTLLKNSLDTYIFSVVCTFNMTLPAFKYAFINGLSKEALRINCKFYTLLHCFVSSCTRMQSVWLAHPCGSSCDSKPMPCWNWRLARAAFGKMVHLGDAEIIFGHPQTCGYCQALERVLPWRLCPPLPGNDFGDLVNTSCSF